MNTAPSPSALAFRAYRKEGLEQPALKAYPEDRGENALFPRQSSEVLAALINYGGCAIVGPANSGKSELLFEVLRKASITLELPTLYVDGNQDSMSAEKLKETQDALDSFHEKQGIVLVDHVDRYADRGRKRRLNYARGAVLDAITNIAVSTEGDRSIAVASQGQEQSDDLLRGHFGGEKRYEFKGEVTKSVARQMLADHLAPDDVDAAIHTLPSSNGLLVQYGLLRRLIEDTDAGNSGDDNDKIPLKDKEADSLMRLRNERLLDLTSVLLGTRTA